MASCGWGVMGKKGQEFIPIFVSWCIKNPVKGEIGVRLAGRNALGKYFDAYCEGLWSGGGGEKIVHAKTRQPRL